MRCPICGSKECCGGDMAQDNTFLRAEIDRLNAEITNLRAFVRGVNEAPARGYACAGTVHADRKTADSYRHWRQSGCAPLEEINELIAAPGGRRCEMDDPIAVIRACAQAMRIFDRPETAAEVDRAADELERLRAAQPANQCDGCARNLPVEDGRHVDRFGMPVMACQAHRYSKPAQPAVPEDRLMQQFDSWWEQHGEYLRAGGGNYERTFAWHAWRESAKQASPAQPAVPVESQEIFPGTTEALNKLSVLPSKDQP